MRGDNRTVGMTQCQRLPNTESDRAAGSCTSGKCSLDKTCGVVKHGRRRALQREGGGDSGVQQGGGGWVGGKRGAESWHQRQRTLSAVRVLWVTCQGFLQLVSVVGALQQAPQRNDDIFKAWPLGHVLPPTVLKHNHNVVTCF